MHWKRLLVLAPHTDDAELGCGGTMARLLEAGVTLHVAAFSSAEESRPPGSEPYLLKKEFRQAMEILQVPGSQVHTYDFPVRRFSYQRQEILDVLIQLRKEIRPDAVLLPSSTDLHQDHATLAVEGLRAFKETTVWGYELPWNQTNFPAQAFVTLEGRHLEKKWSALKAYASQLALNRPYFSWEMVEGLARVRGVQVKSTYAEAFEVVRFKW